MSALDDILSGRVTADMARRDQGMPELPASVTVTACTSADEARRWASSTDESRRMAAERWRRDSDVRAATADNVERVKRMREALGLIEQIRAVAVEVMVLQSEAAGFVERARKIADDVEALGKTADQIRKAVCS